MEPRPAAQAPAPDLQTEARVRVASVIESLLEGRTRKVRSTILFDEFCRHLTALGIRLERSTIHMRQLHPQLLARSLHWRADAGGALEMGREHGVETSPFYLESPIRYIYEGGAPIRRRLADGDCVMDFPILQELKAEGYTDYYMCSMPFSVGRMNAIGFSTKHSDGFSDLDIAMIDGALPAFGSVMELNHMRRTATTLLQTYLGPSTGEKVLAGAVKRGDGEIINAVLWYCDMRSFTPYSESLPIDQVIGMLNEYFEAITAPVKAEGGEILKFIGDAVLAVFPLSGLTDDGRCAACSAALSAASGALESLARLNEKRAADGEEALRCGIALARGDVMYGNIGDQSRLDFTVIGPAVNLASRLEGLTYDLEVPIVFDEKIAANAGRPIRSLGHFPLKGIEGEREAFTVA